MAEYIEKSVVLNALIDVENRAQGDYQKSGESLYRDLCDTEIRLGKIPSADVAPVVHARWIHTDSHLWYKTNDGRIDEWRLDVDYHNGPECQVCGYTPCMHCHPDYMEDKCPQGHYICSECANESVDGHEKFCSNCGAKMDLEKEMEEK